PVIVDVCPSSDSSTLVSRSTVEPSAAMLGELPTPEVFFVSFSTRSQFWPHCTVVAITENLTGPLLASEQAAVAEVKPFDPVVGPGETHCPVQVAQEMPSAFAFARSSTMFVLVLNVVLSGRTHFVGRGR